MSGLEVTLEQSVVPETFATYTVRVTRTGDRSQSELIFLSSDDGDVATPTFPIFLLPNQRQAVFEITIIDNVIAEADREVTITATSSLTTRDPGTATLIIENDDSFGFFISPLGLTLNEDSGSLRFAFIPDAATAGVIPFELRANIDGRVSFQSNFTFDRSGSFRDFEVTGLDDDVFNGDQTIELTLTSPADGYNAFSSTASFTLLDDEFIRGTAADDDLRGSTANELLDAGEGNDTLNGLGGDDTMIGGAGDDRYRVDSLGDVVTEDTAEGYDRVLTSISLTLPDHVEAGNLTGSDDLSLNGNAEDNWLNGNSGQNLLTGGIGDDRLDGNAGNDTLNGGLGNDVLEGGTGADIFVVEQNGGVDLILDFELGTDLIDITGTGLSFADLQISEIDGDALITYDSTPVVGVVRLDGISANALTAANFIEAVGAPLDIVGTNNNDFLRGTDASETLQGLLGNDRLRGDLGDDTLNGGDGDDTHEINSAGDVIVEGNGVNSGYDRALIYTNSIVGSSYTLSDNVEAATLQGTQAFQLMANATGTWMVGNDAINQLIGAAGNDRLDGRGGNDQLNGGAGDDILEGGDGSDTFVFEANDGKDQILNYSVADDNFLFIGVSQDTTSVAQVGANVVISYDTDDLITLLNQNVADFDLNGSEFSFL